MVEFRRELATVDAEGKVTPTGAGQTIISASTTGNDDFAAGNAKYNLTVINCASNLKEMKEMAPNAYERVYVDFPVTVNYANGISAFVSDSEGNAARIENVKDKGSTSMSVTTIYKVGNVIPAGWTATNAFMYESTNWQGIPPAVTETVKVEYPEVSNVTPEDADKVVVLKNVSFESRTPENNSRAFGTTPDNTTYEFQNTYNTGSRSAGTYNVTCIVNYSKIGSTEYFYLAPIAYSEASSVSSIDVEESNECYYDLNGVKTSTPKNGVYIKKSGSKTTKVIIK